MSAMYVRTEVISIFLAHYLTGLGER